MKTKEEIKLRKKAYYEKNKELILLRNRIYYYFYYGRNRNKKLKQNKEYNKKNPDKLLIAVKNYNKKNPEKLKAQKLAQRHIFIPENKSCEICQLKPAVHKHHKDYSKPFDVNFLCVSCHNEVHSGR